MPNDQTLEPISANLRHDEKVRFLEVCDEIGTTPSNAIRMFVAAFNRKRGFPFAVVAPVPTEREFAEQMDARSLSMQEDDAFAHELRREVADYRAGKIRAFTLDEVGELTPSTRP